MPVPIDNSGYVIVTANRSCRANRNTKMNLCGSFLKIGPQRRRLGLSCVHPTVSRHEQPTSTHFPADRGSISNFLARHVRTSDYRSDEWNRILTGLGDLADV